MSNPNFETMVNEYTQTAQTIKSRIVTLKAERMSCPYDKDKRLEERIAILEAEHSHLIKISAYLRDNYTSITKRETA